MPTITNPTAPDRHGKTQGKFYKRDLLAIYDNVSIDVFEGWITDIQIEIGWIAGKKQLLTPLQVRRIIQHIGEPITLHTLNK